MSKTPRIYKRLPGRGARPLQILRLWEGPDHLLFVASSILGERYKRFYYAEIQSITVQKTSGWMLWIIFYLILAGAFGWIAVSVDETAGRITLGILAAVFLVFLAVHLAFGPTCRCVIRTAVQTEELASLKRVRNANKVLARLRPQIEAAQQQQQQQQPNPSETTTPA